MKPTWYRASGAIYDPEPREETWSMFFDYNILRWTVGFSIEPDPCWLSFNVEIGPIQFSLTYWRRYVELLS